MHDLNLNLFYKTSFDIEVIDPDAEALWLLICDIRRWMSRKWQRRGVELPKDSSVWMQFRNGQPKDDGPKNGYSFSSEDPDHTVRMRSAGFWGNDGPSFWACEITERIIESGLAPRHWVTDVGFVFKERGSGKVSIVISYGDRPGFLGPRQEDPTPTIPGLISTMMRDGGMKCTSCGLPLEQGARALVPGDFNFFWDVVSNPERDVPVVYISPFRGPEGDLLAVDPGDIASVLGPSALVFCSYDRGFNGEMKALLPDAYRCFNGYVRVYAPGINLADQYDSIRHRFFAPGVIAAMGEEAFGKMLRRALAQDVDFYERMVRLDVVKEMVRRRSREKSTEKRIDAVQGQSLEMAESIEEELNVEQAKNDRLKKELEEAKDTAFAMECRAMAAEAALEGRKAPEPLFEPAEYSPMELARAFRSFYPDRLDFTEAAWASLEECPTKPELLWNAFRDLCTIAYDLLSSGEGGDVAKEFNDRSSFEFVRGAGTMTRKDSKLMSEYEDEYQGRPLDAEAHIRKGSKETDPTFLRIYFGFDAETGRIVVSSAGKHKKNYSTRKLK